MSQSAVNFGAFKFEKYFWLGAHQVSWLGSEAEFIIKADPVGISTKQRQVIEFVCNLPNSTREQLELFLFDEYQSEIFGSIDSGDDDEELTPQIKKSKEIWKLVSSPGIHIPPDNRCQTHCYFEVTFECVWDPEHGIAVLFNDQGEPIDLGGQGSHF